MKQIVEGIIKTLESITQALTVLTAIVKSHDDRIKKLEGK